MNVRQKCILVVLVLSKLTCFSQQKYGANVPWMTYEAESMHTNGIVLGLAYDPYKVETESSGQQCVKLGSNGQYVEFAAKSKANSLVVRYSLPDSEDGNGTNSTFGIYINGKFIRRCKITSHYAWLYGKYPFTNNPDAGVPRHFYDELRIKGMKIAKGDIVQIKRDDQKGDDSNYTIIDLVDLENIAPPLQQPANSLSITDKSFLGSDFNGDYTVAFKNCIAKAIETGKSVWIPVGEFKITGDIILPSNVTVQGAGMWYSQLVGDSALYHNPNNRVRIKGSGSNIHISDFAVIGKLNYRIDHESSDGIVGSYGENSTISNLWIEHTKVGMWIENSKNLKITGCRMRNTMADGINFCVGMAQSTIKNCSARGTGDDCFAIWPTVFMKQVYAPGHNLIINCTGQLPYLANGGAIYGGDSNVIKNCLFTDISQGSAILVSTTFPTESKDKSINNNFSGTTIVEDCDIKTSGGFDHDWDWRAAVEICLDKRGISGLEIKNLNIQNSLSNALSVIAKNIDGGVGVLTNSTLENVTISNYGIGVKGKNGLFISKGAHGNLTIIKSKISDVKNESAYFSLTQ
ncbi:glycosyl hydrolase family 28-related protein [Mucilaginibacter sp.]